MNSQDHSLSNDESSISLREAHDHTSDGVRTLRMALAYDGTKYCGWQLQPNGISLQAVVEQALREFTGEAIKVVASGRTDAGVHAIGQVISFTTQSTTPCHGFLHGLACHLPDDVVVRNVQEAELGFNARYHAKSKWYRYVIHNSPIRLPFLRDAVLWQRTQLDHEAMHVTVQCLIGTHDFRCFETHWPNRSSSIRTVTQASVTRTTGWDVWNPAIAESHRIDVISDNSQVPGIHTAQLRSASFEPSFLCFDIKADGFLYNMVRSIVGTLIHVGRGRWTPGDMLRILRAGDRTLAGETAPPQGLYLMRVDY